MCGWGSGWSQHPISQHSHVRHLCPALGTADTAEQLHFQHCLFRLTLPHVASAPRHELAEEPSTPGDAARLLNSSAALPLLLVISFCYFPALWFDPEVHEEGTAWVLLLFSPRKHVLGGEGRS